MKQTPKSLLSERQEHYILDPEQIEKPQLVFDQLFDAYEISDLRRRLRDMLDSALFDRDCDAQSYFFLFRHLEKLVEAAHVAAARSETTHLEPQDTGEQFDEKSYKPPRLEEIASLRPMEALQKTFNVRSADALIEEIEKWKRRALTGAASVYNGISQRDQLWTFCDQLMCLVESAHIFYRDQQASEKQEMESFFRHFTLTYARRELSDCFEAILTDERQNGCIDKSGAIAVYHCLLSIIISAYHVLEDTAPDSVVMYEKRIV